jgi:hypothetical protein
LLNTANRRSKSHHRPPPAAIQTIAIYFPAIAADSQTIAANIGEICGCRRAIAADSARDTGK